MSCAIRHKAEILFHSKISLILFSASDRCVGAVLSFLNLSRAMSRNVNFQLLSVSSVLNIGRNHLQARVKNCGFITNAVLAIFD